MALLKLFARQSFGGHREQEERYHGMIEWTILVGCLFSVGLLLRSLVA